MCASILFVFPKCDSATFYKIIKKCKEETAPNRCNAFSRHCRDHNSNLGYCGHNVVSEILDDHGYYKLALNYVYYPNSAKEILVNREKKYRYQNHVLHMYMYVCTSIQIGAATNQLSPTSSAEN